MPARLLLICFALLLTARTLPADEPPSPADEPQSVEDAFAEFIDAFAEADLERMKSFYAENVSVMKGCSLLDPELGGIAVDPDSGRNQQVERQTLLDGYERIIERTGGKENWVRLMQQIKSAETQFLTRDSERGPALFAARNAEPDDVFVFIRPETEVITFQMRRIDGKWRIVFEMVCL